MGKITEILTQLTGQQVYIDTGMVEETRLSPKNLTPKKDDLMSYVGIFPGAWGETSAELETTTRNLQFPQSS